jgi:hypothetical protein
MNTRHEIENIWRLIPEHEGRVIEVRAFHYQKKTRPKIELFRVNNFASTREFRHEFEEYVLDINRNGFNVYMTLNPIRASISGRSASDDDILYRDTLLIDIDRAGDTKQPASDEELALSDGVATRISFDLSALGWGSPIKVMSGNGYHLYYRLDNLPNNDDTSRVIKRFLNTLADSYDTKDVKVDRVVFNASRITKVPGTVMRKGEESECRPYRMAKVL